MASFPKIPRTGFRSFGNILEISSPSPSKAHVVNRLRFSFLILNRNPLVRPSLPSRDRRLSLAYLPLLPLLRPLSSPPESAMTTEAGAEKPQLSDSSKTVRVVVKGRVQGVFYRNWTIENANQLGLKGWVRNRRDGSVEALFSGPPEAVEEMQKRSRRGPPAAVVTGLDVFQSDDDPGTSFQRRPTV